MDILTWQAIATLAILAAVIVAMVRDLARPDLVFLLALAGLLLTGILEVNEAFAGFSNSAIWVVGSLFVVAEGVHRTDLLAALDPYLFTRSKSLRSALLPLLGAAASMSAFVNNTPVVAMLAPRVQAWSERMDQSASKFLIPLSYATIVGGMLTLVGTSTNIVVSGLLEQFGHAPLGLFAVTPVGLPIAVGVVLYLSFIGHRLLPSKQPDDTLAPTATEGYVFELRVGSGAHLDGSTIDEAGLRSLRSAYLVHVRRDGRIIEASPSEVLSSGDVLAFVGDANSVEQLLERRGLEPVIPNGEAASVKTFPLYEAVVADTSRMIGHSLSDVHFRDRYGGVVLAIHRRNQKVTGPIGRTLIKEGDLLLVEARNGFDERWNARGDEFYLVAPRSRPRTRPVPSKAPFALAIVAFMILAAGTGLVSLTVAAFCAALGMIITGCISTTDARRSVNMQVLVIIAAALAIGSALEKTGLAAMAAHFVIDHAGGYGAVGVIAGVYIGTNVLTELITNTASAAIMVPVGLAAAVEANVPIEAVAVTVAIAASASFVTPIGYQTNLMVMSAGSYRFSDYTRAGLPVSIITLIIALSSIYLVWLR